MLNTFDKHIIIRLVKAYLAFVLMLILFFIALHYVEYTDDFQDRGATSKQVFLEYYPSYIPEIIKLISPLALFLSVIFLTAKLSSELALVALHSSAVSLRRILLPFLGFGLVVTCGLFYLSGWVVPKSNVDRIDFENQYIKQTRKNVRSNNLNYQTAPGKLLNVGFYDQRSKTAYRVSLFNINEENRIIQRMDARNMTWVDSLKVWRISDPIFRDFQNEIYQEKREESRDSLIGVLPQDLARSERDGELLTITESKSYLRSLERSGLGYIRRPFVEYYTKFSYPISHLILVLLGLPLAARRRVGGQATQIGIGLAVAFVYLAFIKIFEPLGYAGSVPSWMAAWAPHILFAFVALLIFYKTKT